MEIWLDTCDRELITNTSRFGFVYGITTNPTLLASIHEDPETILNDLLNIQEGPIAVQISHDGHEEMIKRALALRVFSDRIIIKIPTTQEGLLAIRALCEEEVPVIATVVYTPAQALLAALAGATYIAPYFGRMLDAGIEAHTALQSMATVFKKNNLNTKILVASLKTTEQIVACAEIGVDAITIKKSLLTEWLADNEYTLDSLRSFAADWDARDHPRASALVL